MDNGKAMVMASFVADSLALGVHWIYDTGRIERDFGRVDTLITPVSDSYHHTKEMGEFTHYGDQAFTLLESLASRRDFDLNDFSKRWRELFKGYGGYVDRATKDTLHNFAQGKSAEDAGSASDEISGASRIAPLVFCFRKDLKKLVDAVKTQVKMTHNSPQVIESGEFFARVSFMVLEGTSPVSAMEEVAMDRFKESYIVHWVKEGIESKKEDSISAITRFGQSCHASQLFPGIVHLIIKYEENLKEALIQSVMAGGDSASRGMVLGMVLGAHLGDESIPEEWISGLKKGQDILTLLEKIL